MDNIQRDATEPDGLAIGGRIARPQVQETRKMRSTFQYSIGCERHLGQTVLASIAPFPYYCQ